MFRFSLISLFLVAAANADIFGTQELKRQLQADFDLDAFQFNFAGVNINAEIAQNACPEPWQQVVSCVISDCPAFMDVCPEFEVPAENQGTVPPAPAPEEGAEAETMPEPEMEDMGNMTMSDENMTDPVTLPAEPVPAEGSAAEEVPSCEEIEQEFCEAFTGEDIEDCCLLDCAEQLQSLVVCLVKETTGEDRSDCTIPECPEPAPGGDGATATDGTPAPAPADSGAAGVVSRVAILATSAIAFFML